MKIVLFGLPASGKGTQSNHILNKYGIPQLSTGDMLRRLAKEEDSILGKEIREIPVGHFANDELIIKCINEELKKDIYKNGVVFDGFPRTEAQATKMIEMGIIPDMVVLLKADENSLVKRIINRRIHEPSGRSYNIITDPPKIEGKDDITGEPLVHRSDDNHEFISKRINDFNTKTYPAFLKLKELCQYGSGPILIEVDSNRDHKNVWDDLNIGIKSAIAIQKIREKPVFTFMQAPYDEKNKYKQEIALRSAMHDCLMRGEIPFCSSLLYYQENMLGIKEKKELMSFINKKFVDNFDKVALYISANLLDSENTVTRKINGSPVVLDKESSNIIDYAFSKGKTIEIYNLDSYQNDNSLPLNNYDININNYKEVLLEEETFNKITNSNEFVIIESPYAGTPAEISKNEHYARSAIVDCLIRGEIPIASHLLYTQPGILDDTQSAQRRLGIEAGLITGKICTKSVCYIDMGITKGMEEGLERAKNEGRSFEKRSLPFFNDEYENNFENRLIKKIKIK